MNKTKSDKKTQMMMTTSMMTSMMTWIIGMMIDKCENEEDNHCDEADNNWQPKSLDHLRDGLDHWDDD